jgi:hypothetical protein
VHPDLAQVLLIAALGAVGLVILVPLRIYLVHKLFFFDWPPLYEWQQARRQLRLSDWRRVIWATYRHHPASRATLADAQLAYARYRQAAAQRALDRRPGWRAVAAVYWGVLAALWVALAATHSQLRILSSIQAFSYAGLAIVIWMGPRSARRLVELMARLQAEIKDRTHVG